MPVSPPAAPTSSPSASLTSPSVTVAFGKELESKGQYTQAAAIYKEAALGGDAEAEYLLGRAYFNGLGLTHSDKDAWVYWTRASEQQFVPAMDGLGYLYCRGLGVPQSSVEAIRLFKEVLRKGYSADIGDYTRYARYANYYLGTLSGGVTCADLLCHEEKK